MKRYLIFLLVFLVGCAQSRLAPSAFMEWARKPENGLCKTQQLGNYEFAVQYRSPEMLACEYYGGSCQYSQLDSIRKETAGAMFFTFRFKPDQQEVSAEGHYATPAYLDYLIGGIENDLMLLQNGDTLYPVSCHYERNYGLSPYQTLNVVFETGKPLNTEIVFLYNDQILSTGPMRFVYEAEAFHDLPTLEL